MSFKIKLVPQASNQDTKISVSGDVLTYNGKSYDFSAIEEGDEAVAKEPAVGLIKKFKGQYRVTLIYKYNSKSALPVQKFDDKDLEFTIKEGNIPDPVKRKVKK